jgi:micrococcal nuclease
MQRTIALTFTVILILTAGCTAISDLPQQPDDLPTPPDIDDPTITETHTVTITHVADGDTMEIRFKNGSTDTIRLLGVDTPEVHTNVEPNEYEDIPDTHHGREWLRGWGKNASSYAKTRLTGETVTIAFDRQSDRRGSYDRLLVYLYLNDSNFNKQLLSNGYARLYDSEFTKRGSFAAAETTARSNDVGLWRYPENKARTAPQTASPAVA